MASAVAQRMADPAAQSRCVRRWSANRSTLAPAALTALAVVLRLPTLRAQPFWINEAWVADSLRAPIGQLKLLTSHTPLLWTAALRLIPHFGGPEGYRALTMAFSVACVPVAWFIGSRIGRAYAVSCAITLMLLPGLLEHHDLKQYTADAFFALAIMALLARADRIPSTLWLLSGFASVALWCSHPVAFSGLAAFAGTGLVAVAARDRRRIFRAVAAGGVFSAVVVLWDVTYLRVAARHELTTFWSGDYIPHGFGRATAFVLTRIGGLLASLRLPGGWPLALIFAAVGTVVMWRAGLRAAALLAPVLLVEMIALGAARVYPFLNAPSAVGVPAPLQGSEKLNLFFASVVAVLVAVGIAGCVRWLWLRPAVRLSAVVVPVALLGAMIGPVRFALRQAEPYENVRDQARLVYAQRRPGDIVLVNFNAVWQFAYYWPERPRFVRTTKPLTILFEPTYPNRNDIVLTQGGSDKDIAAAATRALDEAGPGARFWVVISHSSRLQIAAWHSVMSRIGTIHDMRFPHPGSTDDLLLVTRA